MNTKEMTKTDSTFTRTAIEVGDVKKFDKAEAKILKLLKGWNIREIECLLVHRVLSNAKGKAKLR
jgi:hypothetical protein